MDGATVFADLRERVVRLVVKGGLSRHQAAAQFWRGHQYGYQLGSPLPRDWQRRTGQVGGYRPKKIAGRTAIGCCNVPEGRFHLARAGGGTRRAGPEGRLPHGVGVVSRREAQS